MSRKSSIMPEYINKMKEYAENLENFSNFVSPVTLSLEEHKMLIEGYKYNKFNKTKEYIELENADLHDFMFLERSYGGTNL